MPDFLIDGDFTRATPVGARRYEFPFRKNGDRVTALFEEENWQEKARFTPELYPIEHPTERGFYLIDESPPVEFIAGLCKYVRTWSLVPKQQIEPSDMLITKPLIGGTFPQVIGSSLVYQPDPGVGSYNFYLLQNIVIDSGPVTSFYPTGGTYTITLSGSTTAGIAYNASAATVQTALNAITSVSNRGSVVVSGSYNASTGFTVTFNSYAAATINTASLVVGTGGTLTSSISTTYLGFRQKVSVSLVRDNPGFSATSTFGPAGSNPMYYAGGTNGIFQYWPGNLTTTAIPATSGTYTITVLGQTTAAIAYDADATTVQAAVNALSNVSARGGVVVTYGTTQTSGINYYIVTLATANLTGGTFTITMFAQTTAAIAYNASAATIQSALNALSNIVARGSCVVTALGGLAIGFNINFDNAAFTTDGSSLTPAGSNLTATRTDSGIGAVQTLVFGAASATRTLTFASAHGFAVTDPLVLVIAGTYASGQTGFTIPDTTSIAFSVTPGSAFATATSITKAGKITSTYNGGGNAIRTRVKRVTDYYLPGVSAGIATMDDIPLPTNQGDDASLLAAIFAGSTSINYEVGELSRWRESPILARTTTKLNATTL